MRISSNIANSQSSTQAEPSELKNASSSDVSARDQFTNSGFTDFSNQRKTALNNSDQQTTDSSRDIENENTSVTNASVNNSQAMSSSRSDLRDNDSLLTTDSPVDKNSDGVERDAMNNENSVVNDLSMFGSSQPDLVIVEDNVTATTLPGQSVVIAAEEARVYLETESQHRPDEFIYVKGGGDGTYIKGFHATSRVDVNLIGDGMYIETGHYDDVINTSGNDVGMFTGKGDDVITHTNGSAAVETYWGKDTVNFINTVSGYISTGGQSDTVNLYSSRNVDVFADVLEGDRGESSAGFLNHAKGDDEVNILNSSNVAIAMGRGDDTTKLDSISRQVTVDGGKGQDVVKMDIPYIPGETKMELGLGSGRTFSKYYANEWKGGTGTAFNLQFNDANGLANDVVLRNVESVEFNNGYQMTLVTQTPNGVPVWVVSEIELPKAEIEIPKQVVEEPDLIDGEVI